VSDHSTTYSWQRALLSAGSIVLLVAALYFARSVVIPVVLAMLLAFILFPPVAFLQRRGLPRVAAALIVMSFALAIVGSVGYVVASQVQGLSADLPMHSHQIADKLVHLREAGKDSWFDKIYQAISTIEERVRETSAAESETQPVLVRVESSSFPWLQSVAGPAVESLVSAVLVIALVAFMLIKREDLRNRLMRIWGRGSLTSMTRALDDATNRISRFLLMQLLVNAGFGAAVTLGLMFIGVPYPALWGLLGMCLRYIPYIGAWVAFAFPFVLSFAVLPGWAPPLLVFGLFLVLELFISNVVEPLLFGRSIGVSEVALLISAAFWTWLWGPMGLVLSTPLTACLAVAGRHVPNLEFLAVLLGDEPALAPSMAYYQRLLARDQDEASDLIEDYAECHNSEEVFDTVLIPALSLARRNRERGLLSREDMDFIRRATAELLEVTSLPHQVSRPPSAAETYEPAPIEPITVFGCPARDNLDELTLEMLKRLLDPSHCNFEVLSPDALTAEVLATVRTEDAPMVCIGALSPQNLAHTRYLCKRLRARIPDLKIIVGCWGPAGDRTKIESRLKEAGADRVATSLLEARSQLAPLVQLFQHANAVAV
jgi:predicted PurR-regulated permease PerM